MLNSAKRSKKRGIWLAALLLALCALAPGSGSAQAADNELIGARIEDGRLKGYYGVGGDIVIPNTVTVIDDGAFQDNKNVTSVTIPGSVQEIRPNAFSGCKVLERIVFSEPQMGAALTIRIDAFANCPELRECIIPACAEYVTGNVFKNCQKLERIQVDPGNPYYFTDDQGVLFGPWVDEGEPQINDPVLALNAYPCGRKASSYTVPGEVAGHPVNQLWSSSFRYAKNLKQIVIPPTCPIIGANVFEDTGLTSLVIPDTVTEVGASLVANCPDLTSVTIEAPVSRLGMSFFQNCTSLQRVEFPATLREMGMYVFKNCTSLTNLTLPEGLGSIDFDTFSGCNNLQRIYIPSSMINFPSVDGSPLDPFEDAARDLIVYVAEGSTGERWAYNNAARFGWSYEIVPGAASMKDLDLGTFSLVDIGRKVKLTGAFHMPDSLIVRPVISGSQYDAFRAVDPEAALVVYELSLADGAAAPAAMQLAVGRPQGLTASAKLYGIQNGRAVQLPASDIGGTLTTDISALGYFALLDSGVPGGGETVDPTVPTGVVLNRSTARVEEGKRLQLSATVQPDTAADKSVTWISSAPTVASVTSGGMVTGVKAGSAVITARTVNGLTASCTVTVTGGQTPPPVPPAPAEGIATAAALRVGGALDGSGRAPFTLALSGASRIATMQVSFETTGTAVSVTGQNGFTLLGDVSGRMENGKYVGTAMLCYLNTQRELFSCSAESAAAIFAVTGDRPTFTITGLTVSGWDADRKVAYGTVTGIDPAQGTFTGDKSYDVDGSGTVDQLDITAAQIYYRAEPGDAVWTQAQACDFNEDQIVDISDYIDILRHFTVPI